MPGEASRETVIPDNPAEDVLDRVIRAAQIAKEFKSLVLDLATNDVRDELDDLFTNPDYVDRAGNVLTDSNILRGEYTISQGKAAEVNPVNYLQAEVSLGTIDGGRVYTLYTSTAFDIPLVIEYSEIPRSSSTLNILARFSVESDGPRDRDEIPFWQLTAVEGLTKQVRKLMQTRRMTQRTRESTI